MLSISENGGAIAVHIDGKFYEMTPWRLDSLMWDVEWGKWTIIGESKGMKIQIDASCTKEGAIIKAPSKNGLVDACRDSLSGNIRLRMWEKGVILVDATSVKAAVEVGGIGRSGFDYKNWKAYAKVKNNLVSRAGKIFW